MITLLHAVQRYAEANGDKAGLAQTPVPNLTTVRVTAPGGLVHAISRPLICLVLQGSKHVTMGAKAYTFNAGDSLLIAADVPTISQVTRASSNAPYLSLVLQLDAAIIADLVMQMKAVSSGEAVALQSSPTDTEVADTGLRLMRLLDLPGSIPVLHAQLVRELHYWLLAGRHGPAIGNDLRGCGGDKADAQMSNFSGANPSSPQLYIRDALQQLFTVGEDCFSGRSQMNASPVT